MTPPLTAEEKERQKKGIPPTKDKFCTGKYFHNAMLVYCIIFCCMSSVYNDNLDGPSC